MLPHTFLRTLMRNVLRKWYQNQGSTVIILTSQKTEIAKSACEPKWQWLLAEDALGKLHFGQKSLVTGQRLITTSSTRMVNHGTNTGTLSFFKIATQWIQSYPCKKKTSQDTEKSSRKFLEPSQRTKVLYTENSVEFGKSCEDLSWNHRTSTPHRSETNGIPERAVRRVKEGTSVLLQSQLDKKWWSDFMECYCYLRYVQDLGKTPYERRFGEPF